MSASPVALELKQLHKSYGEVQALRGIDFTVQFGEVRALLGKNGAGKSTLVNLVSGGERPTSGEIWLAGEKVAWHSPGAARDGGVSVVHQELSLAPNLSVAENISLGQWTRKGIMVDRAAMARRAETALARLGIDLPLWREASKLSLAQQQLVEIAKAVAQDARLLILDEPTSALNAKEVDELIGLVRRLAGDGIAVIYVSHRMQEIPRVADSLTVLRDGQEVATLASSDASPERVAALIAGDELGHRRAANVSASSDEVLLEVRDLVPEGGNHTGRASFDVRAGEVLGLAGVLGSGRSEILEAIYGARRATGTVVLSGRKLTRRQPARMLSLGIGMTPEDRKGAGIIAPLSVGENLLLSARGRTLPAGLLRLRRERAIVDESIAAFSIATSTSHKLIAKLSGGNQQKAVIGRLLASHPKVLLLDEPTRGVDLHAKAQIYELVRNLAVQGVGVVFVSSELEELGEVCDRVLVIREGRVTAEVLGADASAENLLSLSIAGATHAD
ncbi:ribose import ATP-binding protein RbsA [Nocardioides baekrokdamisoli]|uniref:Ribose import ATP-binding protein RbsA n=1 Tax=Nocardioides baekrokdamisoli TaxID=1804624 RepID=A0A3G9IEP5_9ACTN|nr:sugar ABC transporter ATP-binding protein [Nocardioides baekrokdamisoli]BBH17460.1 ribose import ATP-binding protein RbsA [Nocardioides baekrokdamisoli]